MNANMKKVKAQMKEHWDMSNAEFDDFVVTEVHDQSAGWEIVFDNGTKQFFIEVNNVSEVWHFQYI